MIAQVDFSLGALITIHIPLTSYGDYLLINRCNLERQKHKDNPIHWMHNTYHEGSYSHMNVLLNVFIGIVLNITSMTILESIPIVQHPKPSS